jgi:hypothetical protein
LAKKVPESSQKAYFEMEPVTAGRRYQRVPGVPDEGWHRPGRSIPNEPDGAIYMGELGKSDAMKSHRTNLDTVDPDSAKSGPQDTSMGKRPQKPEIRLGREAQARIGELLRSMYNSYVTQGVPQHLDDLVRRLGEQD